jgi:hypothetical protein
LIERIKFAMTLEEVGAELGLSRSYVAIIQRNALKKLGCRCLPTLRRMQILSDELRRDKAESL